MTPAADPTKSKTRYVQHWETVAVTALPAGWLNVWRAEDGKTVITEPCPALLVQELRETVKCWDVPAPPDSGHPYDVQTSVQRHEPPYEVRVVFASHELGQLNDVTEASNYLGAVGPGEDATVIYGSATT